MKNLNLSRFLFIPLLCAGLTASAQSNSLTGNNGAPVITKNTRVAFTSTPIDANAFSGEKVMPFAQASAFKKAAQADAATEGFAIGLELEALLPMGSFGDLTKVGAGIAVKGIYHLTETGAVTGTVGYNYFLPNDDGDYKYSGIPIKVGYMALFGMFFVEPQVGVYNFRTSFDDEDIPSVSSTNLFLGARAGINIGSNSHLGVGYNYIKTDGGSTSFASAGISFAF